MPGDVGRPVDHIKQNLVIEEPRPEDRGRHRHSRSYEEEVLDREGRWYRLQIRPYTTDDKRVDGAVLSVVDIDVLKRAIGAAEWARDYAKATIEALQVPLVVFNEQLDIVSASAAFEESYGVLREALAGHGSTTCWAACWTRLRSGLHSTVCVSGTKVSRGSNWNASCRVSGNVSCRCQGTQCRCQIELLMLLSFEDITERQRAEVEERAQLLHETALAKASAEDANRTKDLFLATLSHELRTPLTSLLLSAQFLRKGKWMMPSFDRPQRASSGPQRRRRSSSMTFLISRAS